MSTRAIFATPERAASFAKQFGSGCDVSISPIPTALGVAYEVVVSIRPDADELGRLAA